MMMVFRLFRLRLALANGFSAAAGYLLFPAERGSLILAAFSGVALLAAGASALNQVQERDLDLLMERTRLRPIPNGDLTPAAAAALGCAAIGAGALILAAAGGSTPLLLGLVSLAWYLGVYTPLKRRTPFALPVGALCGALPPVIGWCIAGGNGADYRAALLAGLLYLWQVPHFWLLQRRHADDYRKAGMPLFSEAVEGRRGTLHRVIWLTALLAATMLLPAFGMVEGHLSLLYTTMPLLLTIILSLLFSKPSLASCLNLYPALLALLILGTS